MATEEPRRRFAPVPVEVSARSSKGVGDGNSTSKARPARTFAPEPVETSSIHNNKDRGLAANTSSGSETSSATARQPRKFAVEPVESTSRHSRPKEDGASEEPSGQAPTKKPRRFAVEPVEMSARSSPRDGGVKDTSKAPRRFQVQPIESSASSNHGDSGDNTNSRRRFAPQPMESTQRRRRSANVPSRRDSELDETPADILKAPPKPPRKFAVELIDTSARTRRASDESSPTPLKYRTDVTPGHMIDSAGQSVFPTIAFRRKPLLHERRRNKQHSFIAPDLETIESSESDQSEAGTPDRSAPNSLAEDSPLTTADSVSEPYPQQSKPSVETGPTFDQFLLEAERKRAEQIFREQALAAFPNSDYHEPVEHYVDNDDHESVEIDDRPATWEGHDEDEDITPTTWRKDTTRIDWELVEIRKHHEALETQRAAAEAAANAKATEQASSPWWNAGIARDLAAAGADSELSQMRKGARPPMLGSDLVFPRSQSPEPARFDTTQAAHALGSQICPLTEQAKAQRGATTTVNGLWGGRAGAAVSSTTETKGLWGGFCSASTATSRQVSIMPSGLVTPAVYEPANPFDDDLAAKLTPDSLRPPTPPHSRSKMQKQGIDNAYIDSVLNSDKDLDRLMEEEYPDEFVTQVFNYLSLGYPTLARPFDEELSKIAGVPISELRQDDIAARNMPKGYIRIGEDFKGREDGTSQELDQNDCARWRALKGYIREWAKQEKSMVQIRPLAYGTAPRKGSWAW